VIRHTALATALVLIAACSARDATAPAPVTPPLQLSGGGNGTAGWVRVTCELRAGRRSRVSVDGNNLTPRNGSFRSRISSGASTAASNAATAIGDEAEFDYDSNPADIALGATSISPNFIVIQAAGPDVRAEILDANGAVVAMGGADCRSR
jgi:hypothetical protein